MTIGRLIKQLQEVLDEGTNQATDRVMFRIPQNGEYREVDYILTKVEPNMLLLCWDDGTGG